MLLNSTDPGVDLSCKRHQEYKQLITRLGDGEASALSAGWGRREMERWRLRERERVPQGDPRSSEERGRAMSSGCDRVESGSWSFPCAGGSDGLGEAKACVDGIPLP